jgi:hypothetical protein
MRRLNQGLACAFASTLVVGAGVVFGASPAGAASTLCPSVHGHLGGTNGCAFVITVGANGAAAVAGSPSPYDGHDDNTYGVVNNSGGTLLSMTLTGSGVFGFDGDGQCHFNPGTCASDLSGSGYGGPGTSLKKVNDNNGSVSFPAAGLRAGAGTYFSLEGTSGASATSATVVTATPVSAVEGAAFGGQVAGITTVGSSPPATQFTATIDWGDGHTSAGTVTGSAGSYTVTGAGGHVYAEEGSYTPAVTVADTTLTAPANVATATGSASVADAPLSASSVHIPAQTTTTPFTVPVATFTDADPGAVASDFTAVIDWGDGTATSAGVISVSGGGFSVAGSHTYGTHNTFAPVVSITDVGGSQATVHDTVTVADSVTHCATGTTCTGSLVAPDLSLQGTTTGTGDLLFSSDPNAGVTALDCHDPFRHDPRVISESDTLVGSSSITETDTFLAKNGTGDDDDFFFWVCFQSSPGHTFTDLFGHTTSLGLLPPCHSQTDPGPCVNSIRYGWDGTVTERLTYPVGDPKHM